MEELSLDELKELIWIYGAIRADPVLLMDYAGTGFRIETAYRGITRTMKDLQHKLDQMQSKVVSQ